MYSVMSSANGDNFIASFPFWIPFISCSCLTAVARSSNTVLNKSGKRGHPCLFPDLRGNAFRFAPCPQDSVGLVGLGYLSSTGFWSKTVLSDKYLLSLYSIRRWASTLGTN